MLLKLLSYDTNVTEAEYRRHRTGLLWVWAGLMLAGVLTMLFAAFGVPLLVTDPARVDFCMGMYTGIGTALLVIAVLQFIRSWQMLRDDKKLRAAYIRDTDERRREISSRAVYAAGMTMVVALSYSSRWEIVKATREIAADLAAGKIQDADINEQLISEHMTTSFMPDPDLLIRTGGEQRISNYLLWQIAYSELYFCDTFWPDFDEEGLHQAIADYQRRQRRFGKTEAQVEAEQSPSIIRKKEQSREKR